MSLLTYVKEIRHCVETAQNLNIVLGNESLDLDSATCSIIYAHSQSLISTTDTTSKTIPVLNVERKDLPLKTEVVYCLKNIGIDPSHLICRDEFDFKCKSLQRVSLMDHHVLSQELSFLTDRVGTIFDHRPLNPLNLPEGNIDLNHAIVGSCASLVTLSIFKCSKYDDTLGLRLLYDAILTDTMGLKADAITTSQDIEAVKEIENILHFEPKTRSSELEGILEAKRSIEHLSMSQLLRKDLKVLSNNVRKVPVSSLPVLIFDLRESRSEDFILGFKQQSDEDKQMVFSVLTGMAFINEVVKRDLFIYSHDPSLIMDLKDFLLRIESFELVIVEESLSGDEAHVLFSYGNGTISRKKLLPHIQEFLNGMS